MIPSRPAATRAFTLIELMVATAVGTLVLLAATGLLSIVMDTWQRQSGEGQNRADARVALELLAEDLASFVARSDGSEWFRSTPTQFSPTAPADQVAPWLVFLASPNDPDRTTEGDTCVLSYRLALSDPLGGDLPVFALYRQVLTPTKTLEHLGSTDLVADLWAPGTDEEKAATSLPFYLASHVLELRVILWLETSGGSLEKIDLLQHEARIGTSVTTSAPGLDLTDARLHHIDLALVAVDPAIGKLVALGQIPRAEALARHGHRYALRIDNPSDPL